MHINFVITRLLLQAVARKIYFLINNYLYMGVVCNVNLHQ